MTQKEMIQKWEEVIMRINVEFENIFLDLKDRKVEIIQKLELKKNQELKKYFPL